MCTIQEEMIFQIPWKHAAKHGWDINKDACLFRSWAIHTGVQGGGGGRGDRGTRLPSVLWVASELSDTACRITGAGDEAHLYFSRTEFHCFSKILRGFIKAKMLESVCALGSLYRIQLSLEKTVVSQGTNRFNIFLSQGTN